jgi:hypothetical protein
MPKARKKPCRICRRWFQPDARVGERQRACGKPECQTARRQKTQADWRKRNPDYTISWRLDQRAARTPPPEALRVPSTFGSTTLACRTQDVSEPHSRDGWRNRGEDRVQKGDLFGTVEQPKSQKLPSTVMGRRTFLETTAATRCAYSLVPIVPCQGRNES